MDWVAYFERKMQEKGFNEFYREEEGKLPAGLIEIERLDNSIDPPNYRKRTEFDATRKTGRIQASVQKKIWLRENRRAESCYLAWIGLQSRVSSVRVTYLIANNEAKVVSTIENDKTHESELSLKDRIWKNIQKTKETMAALDNQGLLDNIPAAEAIDKIVEKFYGLYNQ